MSDYTNRNLAYQGDTERALLGVFERPASHFHRSFIHGLLDTELEDTLLWCPIGSSARRTERQTWRPLFPSWSWLGWIGHAAYPWAVEKMDPFLQRSVLLFSGATQVRVLWRKSRGLRGPSRDILVTFTCSRWRRDPDDS